MRHRSHLALLHLAALASSVHVPQYNEHSPYSNYGPAEPPKPSSPQPAKWHAPLTAEQRKAREKLRKRIQG